VANTRKIIVHIATSADGYIARPDGDIEWLSERPPPKGFYGMGKFMKSIDAKVLGRKTYDLSVQMGATFDTKTPHYVFSRRPAPASVPAGVEFISETIGGFAKRLRTGKGKDIWIMGGGEIIASFLDEGAIDDFIISVIPTFIGEGIPLIAQRHRHVPLRLQSVRRFPDGVVQVHYKVQQTAG
jgi:dihydrofolate reductase